MKRLIKEMIRPLYHFIRSKKERQFNRLVDKYSSAERFVTRSNVKFLNYTFDVPDLPSFCGQFKEIFVDETYNFKPSNEKPTIIDCGSNIGMSLLYFSKHYPAAKIIGFEADDEIAEISIKNLKRNNVFNCEVYKRAVWINEKGVSFSSEGADGGSINGTEKVEKVKSIRLKDFLDRESNVDMLKIDIEGAEYEVLLDCSNSLSNVNNIFIEYHSWNNSDQNLSEIIKILEQNNFRYDIQDIEKRKQPFINRKENSNMDLQLNVFGYRIKK